MFCKNMGNIVIVLKFVPFMQVVSGAIKETIVVLNRVKSSYPEKVQVCVRYMYIFYTLRILG